jgi:hypothetical protein
MILAAERCGPWLWCGAETHFRYDHFTAWVHNLYRAKTPFGSANFNSFVNHCIGKLLNRKAGLRGSVIGKRQRQG